MQRKTPPVETTSSPRNTARIEPAPRVAAGDRISMGTGATQGLSLRRILVIALIVAAAAVIGWWFYGRGSAVRVAVPTRGDAAEVVYATGNVEPVHWAKVSALQRKRIIEICRCEGQAVSKGQVLARLDDAEERAVLGELEARQKRNQDDVARLSMLVERNVTSRTTYEEKLTQLRESEAKVTAQKDRIEDLRLKSPMDGVVLRRDGEVGEIAGTGSNDVLLWVGQPRPLRVVAEVNEDDIRRVITGQRTLLRHEGHSGSPLAATVESITPKGDPQTKTFRVYLALPDDSPLKVGMSVEANIVIAEAKGVLLVPTEAIAGQTVQVVEGGRAQIRTIETGIRGTRMIEVRSGLDASQRLVSPFQPTISSGARVRIVDPSRP